LGGLLGWLGWCGRGYCRRLLVLGREGLVVGHEVMVAEIGHRLDRHRYGAVFVGQECVAAPAARRVTVESDHAHAAGGLENMDLGQSKASFVKQMVGNLWRHVDEPIAGLV